MSKRRSAKEIRADVSGLQEKLTDADLAFQEAILYLIDEVAALSAKATKTDKKWGRSPFAKKAGKPKR